MLFEQLKKWRRWLLWLAALGLLLGWSLTWALDAPARPKLAERGAIQAAAVHVSGTACGQFSEGSGFAINHGLVVTNAHVVAGVDEIKVTTPEGRSEIGVLVGFDPGRDIAAISLVDLEVFPVGLASAVASADDLGDVASVDSDTGLEFIPFRVNRRLWASGRNIYAEDADNRRVLEINSLLAAGDSGAALVNQDGDVWGMVFAVARGQRDQGYALDLVEISEFLGEIETTSLSTPPCRTR